MAPAERFRYLADHAGLPHGFPPAVIAEVEAYLAAPGTDDPALADLTAIPFVTIDGPGTRDLDQAVHVADEGSDRRNSPSPPVAAFTGLRKSRCGMGLYCRTWIGPRVRGTTNPQMACPRCEISDRHMSWHRFGYAAERRNLTSSGTITSGAGPWS